MVHAVNSTPVEVNGSTTDPEVIVVHHPETSAAIWNRRWEYVKNHFPKLVAGVLVVQGLWALYQSVSFILIEFPLIEQQLSQHIIDQQTVNKLANQATLEIVSTVISMIFALRITIVQTKLAQRINTVIGLLLVLGNSQISTLLNQIGNEQLLTTSLANFFKGLFSFGRNIETTIQQEIPPELKNQ